MNILLKRQVANYINDQKIPKDLIALLETISLTYDFFQQSYLSQKGTQRLPDPQKIMADTLQADNTQSGPRKYPTYHEILLSSAAKLRPKHD